jgi:hypothetical protein
VLRQERGLEDKVDVKVQGENQDNGTQNKQQLVGIFMLAVCLFHTTGISFLVYIDFDLLSGTVPAVFL